MGEPFIGEIRTFGFNFPPAKWAFCDGQTIPITQNPTLYSLLGTNYGGNGTTDFGVPDLRGRTPVHRGSGYGLGYKAGVETVTITLPELAAHTHMVKVSQDPATGLVNIGGSFQAHSEPISGSGRTLGMDVYGPADNLVTMADATCDSKGGNQSHNNLQPTLILNYCIALEGTYPPRN
ncbi:phage tail protein [Acanthopleuribacter pedis]|uniref:Phage tail protein n=1 Tax=Acanthopleuribacter pedis TaxID=442870 RepID=A0A8J7QRH2_9BACT|nr:tail fiber protein [Acanthopleuribacter pedis]MBO1322870.1 phage tail protein [Acanthopleuribacter pedis]